MIYFLLFFTSRNSFNCSLFDLLICLITGNQNKDPNVGAVKRPAAEPVKAPVPAKAPAPSSNRYRVAQNPSASAEKGKVTHLPKG